MKVKVEKFNGVAVTPFKTHGGNFCYDVVVASEEEQGMGDIDRKFRESHTGGIFHTLKAAIGACKYPQVERVWLRDGQVIGRYIVFAHGDPCCSVRFADENIAQALERKEDK